MEQGANKVFVNPNFKKRLVQPNAPSSVKMHINPAFSHQLPPAVTNYKPKIFINPNFVKPKVEQQHNYSQVENVTCHINRNFVPKVSYGQTCIRAINIATTQPSYSQPKPLSVPSISTYSTVTVATAPTLSKSRYNLVRAVQKPSSSGLGTSSNVCIKPQTNTIKLSRYKSVNVNNLKKSIFSSPSASKKPIPYIKSPSAINKYKFIKGTINSARLDLKHNSKYKLSRRSIDGARTRSVQQRSVVIRKPATKRRPYRPVPLNQLKLNNIPCPLYRKFGKCLRRERNACHFLHDRKHVAICRKFIRGLCFEASCLLSHELTSNKMPTCHFYLRGVCAKENCPYLHVKLSETTKVCPDFLKGYCEKGDACLKRHVLPKKVKTSGKKTNTSVDKSRPQTKRLVGKPQQCVQSVEGAVEVPKDGRYYKENVDTSEECVIKPTRVKLGTLPSFIKL